MALHPRLGVDSRLADLGDAFALVLKLLWFHTLVKKNGKK
jgi:hypothetical protein